MKRNKTVSPIDFKEFVANDVNNQKGIFHPIKASFLERLLVRKVSYKKLHPNASDEFTFSDIGPSYRIIAEYEKNFRHYMSKDQRVEILPQKVPPRYNISLHIDDETVICSYGSQMGFEAYQLDAPDDEWVEKIIAKAEAVKKKREL